MDGRRPVAQLRPVAEPTVLAAVRTRGRPRAAAGGGGPAGGPPPPRGGRAGGAPPRGTPRVRTSQRILAVPRPCANNARPPSVFVYRTV
nr:hypothetical protein [Nocardia wallacei]